MSRSTIRLLLSFGNSLVLLEDPLSALSLSSLLEIPLRDVGERSRHLHSVLNIVNDRDAPVRLLYLLFRDFLVENFYFFELHWVQAADVILLVVLLATLSRGLVIETVVCVALVGLASLMAAPCRRREVSRPYM